MMTNLETIQHLYACFASKDYEGFVAICSPDITWVQNPGFPGGGTHHGGEAIVEKVFKGFSSEWDGWRFVIEEYLNAGATIVVVGYYEGTHRVSRKSFKAAAAHVYDVEQGLVSRFRQFTDTHVIQEARRADA